jgi:hypothetical protein
MGPSLGMKMNSSDDWNSLINQSFGSESGDVPNKMGPDSDILGTNESRLYAGFSEESPKSPESPTKKQGMGNSEAIDARVGGGVGQLNCDNLKALPIIQAAPDHGHECGNCRHLYMQVFNRIKDRRIFHWRCARGYLILELHHAGERLHVAPLECNQYQP